MNAETGRMMGGMMERSALIARKHELRRRIERLQAELEQARVRRPAPDERRIRRLEHEVEQLMGEEYSLRVAIDRCK